MVFPNFLKIAVVPYAGIFEISKTHNNKIQITGGSEKEFLEVLSKALKLDYEILIPDVGTWGDKKNGTWTGVIGMVHSGQADIGLGKISITQPRKMVVDFSHPYDIEDLTFATTTGGYLPKTESFLKPFDTTMWCSLVIATIIFVAVFRMVQQTNASFLSVTLQMLGFVLQQPVNMYSTKASVRILLGTWIFMARFITVFYSVALLSFLTVPIEVSGIKNIEDLDEKIVEGTHRVVTFSGASYLDSLKHSQQAIVKDIADKIQQNDWLIKPTKEIVLSAMDGKTAIIAPRNFLKTELQNVAISQDSFITLTRAIVIRSGFCCSALIDMFVLRICAAGIYKKILNDELFREKLRRRSGKISSEISHIKHLTIEDVSGAFLLLLFGYFFAICACILEVIVSKSQSSKQSTQKKHHKMFYYERKRNKNRLKLKSLKIKKNYFNGTYQ